MFRLLKTLLHLSVPKKSSRSAPPTAPPRQEERIALSAFATFDAEEFFQRTGYRARNEEYFLQALVHRSYLQLCPPGTFQSNERMEFLGDSVLNLVVGEHLYHQHPKAEEGELSKIRSRLVNRSALAALARVLKLEDFLLMSPSAHQAVLDGSNSILVDAMEAFIAAIYLDGGYAAARLFIADKLLKEFEGTIGRLDENYKSRLLEFAQARRLGIPRYVVVDESGPDHSPVFTVEVQVNGVPVGAGKGGSKKLAEQNSARSALEHLQSTTPPQA